MANTKPETAEAAKVEIAPQPKVTAPKVVESVYTAAELANNYKAFGTYREIVVVALRLAGKKTATFTEAKKIVDNFKNKEVK